jgi:hypothetical protein
MKSRSGRLLAVLGCLVLGQRSIAQTVPAEEPAEALAVEPYRSDFSLEPDGWESVDSPDAVDNELDYSYEPHRGMFRSPLRGLTGPVSSWRDQLYEDTGLRVGLRYMTQFQQASGGPGERGGAASDIDLMFDWTLVGRGTANTGRFVFTVEERYRDWYEDITPQALRGEIGSLVGTTGAFTDRGLVIRDVLWDQRLLDGRLRLLGGRGAPDDYAGSHRFQSSVMGFFNGNLAGNVTTPWPGHGPLVLASVHPNEQFFITAGTANSYSTTTQSQFSSLDEGKLFTFGEVGYSPMVNGVGRALITVTGWYMPSRDDPDRPSDQGISFTYQQDIGDDYWVMGRYGYADEGLTTVQSAGQAAAAVEGLLGSPENATGVGIGYAEPANGALREETSIDAFHRFQLTEHTQFSIGAQLFINPSNAPEKDTVGVFSLRLRIDL